MGLVVVAAVLMATKFYLEAQYKEELDKLAALVRPFATLEYNKVAIEFDGGIAISGVRLYPTTVDASFTAKKIKFFSSDRMFLVKGHRIFENGKMPDILSMTVEDLDTDPSFGQEVNPREECRFIHAAVDFSSLGIDSVVSDFKLKANFSDRFNSSIDVVVDSEEMSYISSRVEFDASQLDQYSLQGQSLPINKISVKSQLDPIYASDVIADCAEKLNMSADEYVSNVVGAPDYLRVLGVDLGESVRQALQKYTRGQAELEVVSLPSNQLKSLSNLQVYKPSDIVSLLHLSIALDGQDLGDISEMTMQLPSKELADAAKPVEDTAPESVLSNDIDDRPAVADPTRKNNAAATKKSYQAVRLSDAKRYIGYRVRVSRKGKPSLKGRLKSYSVSKLKVQKNGYGGSVVLPVFLSNVSKIEVYR